MLSKLIGEKRVDKLLLIAYSALAIGITCNKIVLSLATMLMFAIVLFDFDYVKYKEAIKKNRIIQLLIIFLFFHLLSYFWSENTSYFLRDLNSKLPFYSIPLVFCLKPIKHKKEIYLIFGIYIFSLTIISLVNFISYFGWRKTEYDDIRSLSLFLSHIRFGLMIVFGFVLCIFWIKSKEFKFKFIPVILSIWFLIYTYFSEVFSCYFALLGIVIISLIYQVSYSNKKRNYIILLSSLSAFLISICSYFYIDFQKSNNIPALSKLAKLTKEGHAYEHDLNTKFFINGNYAYTNICEYELKREWAKVAKSSLKDSNDLRNNNFYNLIKYMSSKGLKKDAEGFKKLTQEDIVKIEKGIFNYKDNEEGFVSRINTLENEFRDPNPNGKTILQRIEYLKAGQEIFKKNWLIGIGSGDLQDEFDRYYIESRSRLTEENRLRTHNQFFTYFISFGILGGLLFLALFYFTIKLFLKEKLLVAILFIVIILISFLSEDTLETQMGGTFFALFFGLFISSTKLLNSSKEVQS